MQLKEDLITPAIKLSQGYDYSKPGPNMVPGG